LKALVLCAGKGTRLRPFTYTIAKQLIPVANKPVLFYTLENVKKLGIEEVGIVVNSQNKEIFEETLKDGSKFGLRIEYILQKEPKGLAHAVWITKDFLKEENFLMYLGDNLILEDLKPFVKEFLENENLQASILLSPVEDPTRFGVAVMRDGKVVEVVEKPKFPPSNLAIVGVYLFRSTIFEGIRNIKPSWRGELEITDAIGYLIKNGYEVKGHVIFGWWKDTGKPDDLIDANRKILQDLRVSRLEGDVDDSSKIQGEVIIEKGAKIIDSIVRGPVIIGKRSFIKNSYIGPYTSIGEDVIIENCEIENSIIMDKCSLSDVKYRLDSSILGKSVSIRGMKSKPSSMSLILGDLSSVKLPE